MNRVYKNFLQLMAVCFLMAAASVAASAQSGSMTVSGTSSSFVELKSGGSITLNGATGGSASSLSKGDALSSVTINLGEVGPSNSSSFVKASVPLRLRSNTDYKLSMSVSFTDPSDADALKSTDIGFGLSTPSRTDAGVKEGTDTVASAVNSDPATASDASAGGRFNFANGQTIADFASSSDILTGDTIMDVIPVDQASTNGLTTNAMFAVKPQFFAPGTFSATVTFTIATP